MDLKLEFKILINKIRSKLNLTKKSDIIYEDDSGKYVQ